MPFEKSAGSQDWLKMPKEGESYDFSQHGEVVEIKQDNGGNPKYHLTKSEEQVLYDKDGNEVKNKVKIPLGYRYVITFLDNKKLSLGSWCPVIALMNSGVCEGKKFSVSHPEKGRYEVKVWEGEDK